MATELDCLLFASTSFAIEGHLSLLLNKGPPSTETHSGYALISNHQIMTVTTDSNGLSCNGKWDTLQCSQCSLPQVPPIPDPTYPPLPSPPLTVSTRCVLPRSARSARTVQLSLTVVV